MKNFEKNYDVSEKLNALRSSGKSLDVRELKLS